MSDNATAPAAPENPEPAPEADDTPADQTPAPGASDLSELPEWAQTEIRSLRGESAKYRTKAKALEDASKTELQRALDALQESKTELESTRTELARSKVMAEHGLSADLAEFLSGDEAQMRAAAAKLATLAKSDTAASLTHTPAAALQSGASAPAAEADDWDPAEIARQVRESGSLY